MLLCCDPLNSSAELQKSRGRITKTMELFYERLWDFRLSLGIGFPEIKARPSITLRYPLSALEMVGD